MSSLFDYLNAINLEKDNKIEDGTLPEEGYVPFMINRGLSYFPDTAYLAQEMNKRPGILNRHQFFILHQYVPKAKRYSKWYKKPSDNLEYIELIQKDMKCSFAKAQQYLRILTEDQINKIQKKYVTGGKIR